MKKLRGVKRYFRNLHKKAEDLNLSFTEDDWYDFWHTHPDTFGYGNLNWKYRREHIAAGLKIYDRICKIAEKYPFPIQYWLIFDIKDSSQDSIYIHTKNPNKNDFPYEFDGIEWSKETPNLLNGLLEKGRFEFGYEKNYPETIWAREVKKYS